VDRAWTGPLLQEVQRAEAGCAVAGVHRVGNGPGLTEPSKRASKRAKSTAFLSRIGGGWEVRVVDETAEVGVQPGTSIGEECREMGGPSGPQCLHPANSRCQE